MTERDTVALEVMKVWLSFGNSTSLDDIVYMQLIAKKAYLMADIMIKEGENSAGTNQ